MEGGNVKENETPRQDDADVLELLDDLDMVALMNQHHPMTDDES